MFKKRNSKKKPQPVKLTAEVLDEATVRHEKRMKAAMARDRGAQNAMAARERSQFSTAA